jgi:hypothetical protein
MYTFNATASYYVPFLLDISRHHITLDVLTRAKIIAAVI